MSEIPEKQHLAPIPESLRKQLEGFKKHLWRIKITEAVFAGLLGLVISFGLVFALDRIWEIPAIVRLLILLAGVSLSAIFAPFWINRWVFKHRKENQLAKLIANHYPNLGDRLLGVVELQDQNESQTALSPELREAAMLAVAHDAKSKDLDLALSSQWLRKLGIGLAVMLILAGGAFIAYPNAGKNALARWFMPLSDTERYTFTKVDLSDIPQPLYVPIGEKFTIPVKLKDNTEQTPQFASAKYGNGVWKNYNYTDGVYSLLFPGKRVKSMVDMKIGDFNHKLDVRPIQRPKIISFDQKITYPDYLQRKSISNEVGSNETNILLGSSVIITATADRNLSQASIDSANFLATVKPISMEEAEIQGIEINPNPEPTLININHQLSGKSIITTPVAVQDGITTLPMTWVDSYGIKGLAKAEFIINSLQDMSPSIITDGTAMQRVMLYNQVLKFQMAAEDDFGIKASGVEWQGEFTTPSPETPASEIVTLINGDPYMTNGDSPVLIDFQARDIKPQKLTIRAWVDDYNPNTPRVYSEPIVVSILSEAEHAKYMEGLLDDANRDLEELMRNEIENLEKNKKLKEALKGNDPAKKEEATSKIPEQRDEEQKNNEAMKELAKKMEELLKESAKNKSMKGETLKQMADIAAQMGKMAQDDMPKITNELDKAQDKKNSNEKTIEKIEKAIEKQEELIDKMKKAARKTQETQEDLESDTFVNRLKAAAADEESIAEGIITASSQSLGLMGHQYSELSSPLKSLIQNIFQLQKQTTSDVNWIFEDLTFFHARTQKDKHKNIIDKMRNFKISEKLSLIEKTIEKQHSYGVIDDTSKVAIKLREWAKLLEGAKDQENQDGGEGGGGDDNNEDKDFEFMLSMMRMMQSEQLMRSKTRALEQARREITPK